MDRIATITRDNVDELLEQLASHLEVDSSTIVPFTDFTDMMTALLEYSGRGQTRVLVAGHASPDTAIAAERAAMESVEILGASPFVSHPEDILEAIGKTSNLVYLANPNRVTGSNFSFGHLNRIAQALTEGVLILDETYHDYYGITGLHLLDAYEHVVVIRSFTAGFGIRSDDSGCLVGSPRFISGFKNHYEWSRITTTIYRLLATSLAGGELAARRLTQVHDEALRITNELTRLNIENRLTSADFLLLRVADPRRVTSFLAGFGTIVENLEAYNGLANYLRYRIQSPGSNDHFLAACRRLPSEHYRMPDIDKRAVMFHRPGEMSAHGCPQSVRKNRLPAGQTSTEKATV